MNDNNQSQFLLFHADDGAVHVNVRLEGETVWLTQAAMAALFDVASQNITMHLQHVYTEGELSQEATCKDFLQVRKEGNREVSRRLKHYNLDAIIAVGYRVNSKRATQFRIWATAILKEYIIKGFALKVKGQSYEMMLLGLAGRSGKGVKRGNAKQATRGICGDGVPRDESGKPAAGDFSAPLLAVSDFKRMIKNSLEKYAWAWRGGGIPASAMDGSRIGHRRGFEAYAVVKTSNHRTDRFSALPQNMGPNQGPNQGPRHQMAMPPRNKGLTPGGQTG